MKTSCIITLLLLYFNYTDAQKLHYEIDLGMAFSNSIIGEYMIIEPSNSNLLEASSLKLGYKFHLSTGVRFDNFEINTQIKYHLLKYGAYMPVLFPGDVQAMTVSKWNAFNNPHSIGIGAFLRYYFGNYFIQPGASYMHDIENSSSGSIKHGFSNAKTDVPLGNYTKGSGGTVELILGGKLKEFANENILNLKIGYELKLYKVYYENTNYDHNWEIRPYNYFILLGYQFK